MKRLLLGTLIVLSTHVSHAQVGPASSEQELRDVLDSIQTVLDQNKIDCKLKLQPFRNFVRLVSTNSLKFKGSCEDKEGTKISANLKFHIKEQSTVIKNLTIKFENIEIQKKN